MYAFVRTYETYLGRKASAPLIIRLSFGLCLRFGDLGAEVLRLSSRLLNLSSSVLVFIPIEERK